MNPEKIHDALNLLDDELIAPVERLRRRKHLRWQHLGALAACLAVVCIVGVFAFSQKPASAESAPEGGAAPEMVMDEALTEQEETKPGRRENDDQLTVPGVDTVDADKYAILMETMLVEVTKLEEDCFTATVLQSDRFYSEGDTVTIHLTELTRIIRGRKVENALPVDDFSEGATLVVNYTFGQDRAVIAECITFGE